MKRIEFWKDNAETYKAKGGFWFRTVELKKFIQLVEAKEGEVMGIAFENNNCELIVRVKE